MSSKIVSELKEVSIDIDQLVELNKTDLQDFKNSGLKNPSDFLKQKKIFAQGAPITEVLDVQFKQPKLGFENKKEVFLPKENDKYSNPRGHANEPNMQNNQNVSYVQNGGFNQSQNGTRFAQSTPSEVVTYKRIIHKLNGDIIEEDVTQ